MQKLSIITICYNEPDLAKTCESIVNQTWQDFEWIVVDGGSNEDTQKIWDKYKYRIDKFISEPDKGRYNAMNKGIALAQGEYLNFLNAGDYYSDSNVLSKVAPDLTQDIVYGNLKFITPNKTTSIWIPEDEINDKILITSTLPHPSSFIKNDLFKKYGGYNETYKIVSDWEKFVIFIKKHNCSYKHIDILCSVFNLNGISSQNTELCKKERQEVIQKYFLKSEIDRALNLTDYTFLEQIFSIKNSGSNSHKIITILGCHLKIKKTH